MKAVINVNGTQFLISENQEIEVNHIGDSDKTVFPEVFLLISDKEVKVGTPLVSNVVVQAVKVTDFKGPKVRTLKYKAKSRYRKVTGFRPQLTRLKITSIGEKKS